jgi:hypothetical protein
MWNRRHRWIRRFAAGLAFAALVVPTAQAKIVEDTGIAVSSSSPAADFKGYGYYEGTPVGSEGQSAAVRPDDRAVRFTPQASNQPVIVSVSPDDRADRFTPAAGNPQLVAAPSTGFDWSDAGIGAGSALGLMLLALGAALATRQMSRKSLAGA